MNIPTTLTSLKALSKESVCECVCAQEREREREREEKQVCEYLKNECSLRACDSCSRLLPAISENVQTIATSVWIIMILKHKLKSFTNFYLEMMQLQRDSKVKAKQNLLRMKAHIRTSGTNYAVVRVPYIFGMNCRIGPLNKLTCF